MDEVLILKMCGKGVTGRKKNAICSVLGHAKPMDRAVFEPRTHQNNVRH